MDKDTEKYIDKDIESIEKTDQTEETRAETVGKDQQDTEQTPLAEEKEIKQKPNNPGTIVLQWVTYAFWGWAVFATSLLAMNVFAHYISSSSDDSFTPYAIAAVLVLLPLSIVCDLFYSKQEPDKKTGGASIIMVVHAVIFALISIGSFVGIAASLIQLVISNADTSGTLVSLYSGIIVTILYILVFMRTLFPNIKTWFKKAYLITMGVVISTIIVFGVAGPINSLVITRNDRLIDDNLIIVQQAIDNYVTAQDKLPASLSDITVSGDAKSIIDNDLVRYVPNSKPSVTEDENESLSTYTTHFYQLCVTYTKEKSIDERDIYYANDADSDGYTNYVVTYNHPAGDYCYKISSYPSFIKN